MPDRKRVLIVYYSSSGNTRRVAKALAQQLDADVARLRERTRREGLLGRVRAVLDSLRERPARLVDYPKNTGEYELTIVGTPVWAGKITPAARAFLESLRGHTRHIAFFTTSGNTPIEQNVPEMEKLAGRAAVAFAGFTASELREPSVYWKKLGAFVASLCVDSVLPPAKSGNAR